MGVNISRFGVPHQVGPSQTDGHNIGVKHIKTVLCQQLSIVGIEAKNPLLFRNPLTIATNHVQATLLHNRRGATAKRNSPNQIIVRLRRMGDHREGRFFSGLTPFPNGPRQFDQSPAVTETELRRTSNPANGPRIPRTVLILLNDAAGQIRPFVGKAQCTPILTLGTDPQISVTKGHNH